MAGNVHYEWTLIRLLMKLKRTKWKILEHAMELITRGYWESIKQ